jgi:hypothetical protein
MKEQILDNAVRGGSVLEPGRSVGGEVTAERLNVMGKVLEFDARKLVRKDNPTPEREVTGKMIEFPKQKTVNNSKDGETRKRNEAIAQALFFCSC